MKQINVMAAAAAVLFLATAGWTQEDRPDRPKREGDRPGARRAEQERGPGAQRRRGQEQNPQDRINAMMRRVDKNGDGAISLEEAPERLADRFTQLDTNTDGQLDKAELAAVGRPGPRGERKPPAAGEDRPGQRRRPDGTGRPEGAGPGAGARSFDPEQMLKRLDKNEDGFVAKDEMPERMAARFERLDGNGDGQLDAEELKKMGPAAAQRGGQRAGRPGNRAEPDDPNAPQRPRRPGKPRGGDGAGAGKASGNGNGDGDGAGQ